MKVTNEINLEKKEDFFSTKNMYTKVSILGEGAYGKVYCVKDEKGNEFAMKRMFVDRGSHIGCLGLKEIDILCRCKHPYLSSAIAILHSSPFKSLTPRKSEGRKDDKLYIVTEKAHFSLYECVWKKVPPISHIKRAMYQLTSAVYYLHANGIIHRDIKPDNVLCYYKNGILTTKLIDFGMTRPVFSQDRNSLHVVTANYRAPELLLGNKNYNEKIDIWALGCTFYEMVMLKDLFVTGNNEMDHLTNIFRIRGSPNESLMKKLSGNRDTFAIKKKYSGIDFSKIITLDDRCDFEIPVVGGVRNPGTLSEFCHLLSNMLCLDPEKRLTAWECLNHPFFSGVDENDKFQYGIIKQQKVVPQNHMLEPPKWKQEGLDLIRSVFVQHSKAKDPSCFLHSVFLGIDLYYRVTLTKSLPKTDHKVIAASCLYIAFKYYKDITAPLPSDLFKEDISKERMETAEIKILRDALGYVIYRRNLYDMLYMKEKYKDPEVLLEVILNGPIYGHTLEDVYKELEK